MLKVIKKAIITLSVILGLMMIPSITGQAAVKTMPDGMKFDPSFYAATYDDVYKAFGMNEALLYQHYLLCGIKEKRLPYAGYEYVEKDYSAVSKSETIMTMSDGMLFDPVFYAKKYPDVAALYGNLPANLYFHYVCFGMAEGRLPYEGYEKNDIKFTFSTVGAIAQVENDGELVRAIRQAGKYRITDLKILTTWDGTMSAETMSLLASGQVVYMKNVYGVKKMTWDVPKVYGDGNRPTIEMNFVLKYR